MEVKTKYQIDDIGFVAGTTLTVDIPIPSKTGYTFKGWEITDGNGSLSGNADSGQTLTAEFSTTDATITLTATWEANQYQFTLFLDGGTLNGDSGTGERITKIHTYGKVTRLSDFVPIKTGYDSLGWYDGETQVAEIPANTVIINKEYTAKWKVKEYKLTLVGFSSYTTTQKYKQLVELDTTEPKDYTLNGWTVNYPVGLQNNADNTFTMPAEDVQINDILQFCRRCTATDYS